MPTRIRTVMVKDGFIRLRGDVDEVVLTFRGAEHLERFLAAFADGWASWERLAESEPKAPADLPQSLPFWATASIKETPLGAPLRGALLQTVLAIERATTTAKKHATQQLPSCSILSPTKGKAKPVATVNGQLRIITFGHEQSPPGSIHRAPDEFDIDVQRS